MFTLHRKRIKGAGMADVYEKLLQLGKTRKRCAACDRHMSGQEMAVFEKYVCQTFPVATNLLTDKSFHSSKVKLKSAKMLRLTLRTMMD